MKLPFSLSLCAAFLLSLTVGHADPAILSFTPNFASSNDPGNITITGTGFYPNGGTLVVKFNGAQDPTATATAADGTLIVAHVPTAAPLGAGPIYVSVSNHIAYSADDFTVIGPGPYVTGFSPIGGSGGASVQIFGSHFTAPGTMSVKFNGVSAMSVVTNADSLLTVTAPGGVSSGP